jgi:hypothetical protein
MGRKLPICTTFIWEKNEDVKYFRGDMVVRNNNVPRSTYLRQSCGCDGENLISMVPGWITTPISQLYCISLISTINILSVMIIKPNIFGLIECSRHNLQTNSLHIQTNRTREMRISVVGHCLQKTNTNLPVPNTQRFI